MADTGPTPIEENLGFEETLEGSDGDKVLETFDLAGIAKYIQQHGCKNVIVMAGAGISVSAGIPDFRTPGSGLYDNLQKYQLPSPTAVFDIEFFRENPSPFYMLARELFPGQYRPTVTHHFIKLLHDKGLLLRCFSQNIDSLETEAGLPHEKLVAAHGNFDSATCIATGEKVPIEEVKEAIMAGEEDENGKGWRRLKEKYGGLVKPDIVFFGEQLPQRFYDLSGMTPFYEDPDFAKCDLLIVMGTSLVVQPFASLIDRVPEKCPRLLINREAVGRVNPLLLQMGYETGLLYGSDFNRRDAAYLGDCDAGVIKFAELLGWKEELREMTLAAGGNFIDPPAEEEVKEIKTIKKLDGQTADAMRKVMREIVMGKKKEGEGKEQGKGKQGMLARLLAQLSSTREERRAIAEDVKETFSSLQDSLGDKSTDSLVLYIRSSGNVSAGEEEEEVRVRLEPLIEELVQLEHAVILTGGRAGVDQCVGELWDEKSSQRKQQPRALHVLPLSSFASPEEDGLPAEFWGWGSGSTVWAGETREESEGEVRERADVTLAVEVKGGGVRLRVEGHEGSREELEDESLELGRRAVTCRRTIEEMARRRKQL